MCERAGGLELRFPDRVHVEEGPKFLLDLDPYLLALPVFMHGPVHHPVERHPGPLGFSRGCLLIR